MKLRKYAALFNITFAIIMAVVFAVCFIEGVMPVGDFLMLFGCATLNALAIYYFRKNEVFTAILHLKSSFAR